MARAEFPAPAYEGYFVQNIVDAFGVEESDIDYITGVKQNSDTQISIITGTFDPDEISSNLEVSESDTESYRGYTVSDDLAWGSDAIIPSGYETALDTRFGDTQAIGAVGTDWQTLLREVSSGTLSGAQSGSIVDSLSVGVARSGFGVNATSDGGATITSHLMFDSESEAADALDDNETGIRENAVDDENTLESIEQRDKRLVLTTSSDTFDFN